MTRTTPQMPTGMPTRLSQAHSHHWHWRPWCLTGCASSLSGVGGHRQRLCVQGPHRCPVHVHLRRLRERQWTADVAHRNPVYLKCCRQIDWQPNMRHARCRVRHPEHAPRQASRRPGATHWPNRSSAGQRQLPSATSPSGCAAQRRRAWCGCGSPPGRTADGDLHEASFVHVVIDTGRWLIERVREPAPSRSVRLDIARSGHTPPRHRPSQDHLRSPCSLNTPKAPADLAPIGALTHAAQPDPRSRIRHCTNVSSRRSCCRACAPARAPDFDVQRQSRRTGCPTAPTSRTSRSS